MHLITAACAGFLVAVLWMDLMFDSQVLRHRGAEVLPESVLASVSAYYRRATTTSRPMGHLIALVMVILLGTLLFAAFGDHYPAWLSVAALALTGAPILLAMIRTVPNAVRLGARTGGPADGPTRSREQSRLAHSICRDHLFCVVSMTGFLVLWLATAWRL